MRSSLSGRGLSTGRNSPASLTVETLEDRSLPATGLTAVLLGNGTLAIIGTQGSDIVAVRQFGDVLRIDGVGRTFPTDLVQRVAISTLGARDLIELRPTAVGQEPLTVPAIVHGGDGGDIVFGGAGNDVLFGDAGNDIVFGADGSDLVSGGLGNDTLFGGANTDALDGGPGIDWLEAGTAGEYAASGWNAHRWAIGGSNSYDVRQGGAGTCSVCTAMIAAARSGIDLAARIQYIGNFTYRVRLFSPITETWTSRDVVFNGNMTRTSWGVVVDPITSPEGEFWTVLYQRAYLRFLGYNPANGNQVVTFPGDTVDWPLSIVTGWKVETTWTDRASPASMREMLLAGDVLTTGSFSYPTNFFVVGSHAYTVVDVVQAAGVWYVRLYNPWKIDGYFPQGPNDGFITLSWGEYQGSFAEYARAIRPLS